MSKLLLLNGTNRSAQGLARFVALITTGVLVSACSPEADNQQVSTELSNGLLRTELNKTWPAPVAAPSEIPAPELPLSPADALRTITMPPGYQLELVASEPLVQDPILAEFDGDGRLWVVEMHGFAYNEDMTNNFDAINDLVILEDTDNDGAFDKRTVFMTDLIMPRAFKILDNNCALVGAPPNLFHACDTDGDLVSDTRDILETTFSELGVVEHGANGLFWGLDNTIYVSQHDWNLKRAGDRFYTAPSVDRGQWGVSQDSAGRIYRNVNTAPLYVDYVAPDYYARNPNLIRTSGLYQNLIDQEAAQIWPARPTPGLNRGYRVDTLRPDGSASYYGGVSSPMIYRGDRLPEELHEQALVVDGPTNIVHLLNLQDDGVGNLFADDFYDRGEFIASTDERFRPVQIVPGWDGTMYIIDMYRGVSQDGPIQTDYLRTYINERRLWDHINLGRIYRVVHTDFVADEKPSMSDDTTEELIAHLSHANGWWRDKGQQYLIQRADPAAIPMLKDLALTSDNELARLHAIWTLSGFQDSGLDALDSEVVTAALVDESWAIRASGLRLSEVWLRDGDQAITAQVMALMNDEHWQVRRQLAATLGELPAEQRVDAIVEMLDLYGDIDSVVVDAAISGLSGMEEQMLSQWLQRPQPHPDVAGMLAGAIAKPLDVATVERLIATVSDVTVSEELRTAMLEGMSQGLEGADGSTGGGVVAGGRAGSRPPGMRPDRVPSVRLELPAEPSLLIAMSEGEGELARAADYAVAVLGWPDKPRAVGRERTPEEEATFVAGGAIYASMCAACHGVDGQGTAVGLPLGGAPYVIGDPSIMTRILIHGKEGTMGLMPPPALNDAQLAEVITYVRGSFGNVADPVNEIAVKEYRQAYTHRDTPWTEEELDRRAR